MSCSKLTKEVSKTLTNSSVTLTEEYFTDWMPAIGVDSLWVTQKVTNMSVVALNYQPIIQTARVRTNKPGNSSSFDSSRTTAVESCTGPEDVHTTTEGQMYFRLGVQYKASAAGLAKADLAYQAVYTQCGKVADSWSGHLEASSTDERFQAISAWMPSSEAEKVMVALIISSLTGNIQFMLTWRTATTSTEAPGAWITSPNAEAAWHTANEETTTAQIATSITTDMWVQFGLRYKLSSGTFGQADVATATCVRRS